MLTPEQTAWVACTERLGTGRASKTCNANGPTELAPSLVQRLETPLDPRHVSDWLVDCDIELVIELRLRNRKMDGAISFSTGTAVIGLSTRFDRMDTFVFALLHGIIELLLGHVGPGDLNIEEGIDDTSEQSDREQQANEAAARWIFPHPPRRWPTGDLSPRVLAETAKAYGVHSCFLIGQLQKEGRLDWSEYRRTIPKVRSFVDVR